jgi:hypothetical protein
MLKELDLCQLIELGDDQACRNYLENLRWHSSVTCPKCGGKKISAILKRDQYNCDNESCATSFPLRREPSSTTPTFRLRCGLLPLTCFVNPARE